MELSLNVKKTKFLIFHYKQRNIENLIPQLKLNEQIIERVTDFWFLRFDNRSAFDMEWACTKNIEQDIKITRDYVQIKTIFTPKYIENLI